MPTTGKRAAKRRKGANSCMECKGDVGKLYKFYYTGKPFGDGKYTCLTCVMTTLFDNIDPLVPLSSVDDKQIIYACHKEDFIDELPFTVRELLEPKIDAVTKYCNDKLVVTFEQNMQMNFDIYSPICNIKHSETSTIVVKQCRSCPLRLRPGNYMHNFISGHVSCHKCYLTDLVAQYNKTKDLGMMLTMEASSFCYIASRPDPKTSMYRKEVSEMVDKEKYPEIWTVMHEVNELCSKTIPELVSKWNTDVWFPIIKSFRVSATKKKRDIITPNFSTVKGYNINCYDGIGRTQVLIERDKDRFYLALNAPEYEPDETSSDKEKTVVFGGTNGSFADVKEALESVIVG